MKRTSSWDRFLRKTRLCPLMLRCDGVPLLRGRTICVACEEAQKRKQARARP